jgi:hypothetical protein
LAGEEGGMEGSIRTFIESRLGIKKGIGPGSYVHLKKVIRVIKYGYILANFQKRLIEEYGEGPFEVESASGRPNHLVAIYADSDKINTLTVEEIQLEVRDE